jgi:carboxyl-terminal processing protease
MRRPLTALALALALALVPAPTPAQAGPAAAREGFDAAAGWAEFERVLRDTYAYLERDDIDVEAQLARSRGLALEARDAAALRRILHQTALTFSDPHFIIGPLEEGDYAIVMSSADLDARFERGRAMVGDVRRGSPAFAAGLRPGDEIVAIEGVPAREAAVLPYGAVLPEPTARQLDYGLILAVNGRRTGPRRLTVRSAGGEARTLELGSTRAFAISLDERPPLELGFVGARADIAHITLFNSLGNNATILAFDAAIEQAKDARGLILDLRETPSGGNTEVARAIIGHFIRAVSPYQVHRIPAVERAFGVPRQFVEYAFPRAPHFGGPVVVLHGRWTGSMGEGIVIGMDAASAAITIGSDMGDLLGALWNLELKTIGARMDLGGEALMHVDGTPREDFVADIALYPANTAPDGSDPGLARALQLLEKDGNADQSR